MSINVNADARSCIETKVVIDALITSNTTTNGVVVDLNGGSTNSVIGIDFSLTSRTDGTYTPLLSESSDNITFTPVEDENITNANDDQTGQEALAALVAVGSSELGYRLNKRYLRVSLVSTGVTTGAKAVVVVKYARDLQS
jgi:hypothetical protein